MQGDSFYAALPPISDFSEITNAQCYCSVPEDWYILVADIQGSTQAIEAGRYKEINFLGASCITAILNLVGVLEIPFVFGGDGATLLIPPSFFAQAARALTGLQQLARETYSLELRIGGVPVETISEAGFEVKVAKLRISPNYYQAVFTGGGLAHAEKLVKTPESSDRYRLRSDQVPLVDLSGLECRWQAIPSRDEETLSLLVLAMAWEDEQKYGIYQQVLDKIQELYGNLEGLNPIALQALNLTLSPQDLMTETQARARSRSWFSRVRYLVRALMENLLGTLFMRFKVKIGQDDWGQYPRDVVETIDYKKFDDMLRMVISSSTAQREQLTEYLEGEYRKGHLIYGLHVSDGALLTCLVFERNGRQVHFVDGAKGGYALAAKAMKQRTRQQTTNMMVYSRLARSRRDRQKPLSNL